ANNYSGGILFQCLRSKGGHDLFAQGGRYDKLIAELQPPDPKRRPTYAVGMRIAWERLVTSMVKYQHRMEGKTGNKKSLLLKKGWADEHKATMRYRTRKCD